MIIEAKKTVIILLWGILIATVTKAQSVQPTMTIERPTGSEVVTDFTGSGPVVAHFKANPSGHETYQTVYVWSASYAGSIDKPFLVRYDEDIDYTFLTTKQAIITLTAYFIQGNDTIVQTMDTPFSVMVTASKLEMPNAFSPNGDGINDVYKAKSNHESILSFKGLIFNRWGKKVFEWTDVNSGWDGTINGTEAAEGVYYCRIVAEGTDGIKYNIRKDINLLRTLSTNTSTTP